jgi:ESF2/ABP1 family protein
MDSRFDTSNWSSQDSQAGPSSKPFPSDQQDDFQQELEEQSDQDELDFDQEEEEGSTSPKRTRLLSPSDHQSTKKKKSKGIIYISRIHPGITPPKVRHLLEGFGDVERLYLQDGREKERKRGNEGRGAGEYKMCLLT